MSTETRDTLLHSQLKDGLKYDILKGSAVSGAQSYKSLCLATKNEEKRQVELRKRILYWKDSHQKPTEKKKILSAPAWQPSQAGEDGALSKGTRFYKCGGYGHLLQGAQEGKQWQRARLPQQKPRPLDLFGPINYLYQGPGDDGVRLIHVKDRGSTRHYVC